MIHTYDDYTVCWISALTIELSAAQAFLDEQHDDLPAPSGDYNVYCLGRMGNHNVVLACLPEGVIGTNTAAYAAANLFRTFPNVSHTLLVGIGGGIPAAGVRLGDVVVGVPVGESGGVIQYDRGTNAQDSDFVRKGFLRGPSPIILNAISKMRATEKGHGARERLENIRQRGFHRPLHDNLFEADYLHIGNDCSTCNKDRLIQRPDRDENIVHYGLIGSGNQVVRNAQFRDQLYKKDKIICLEMEAAGLLGEVECIVIRGICDYCDTHKNKDWQPYAGAVAAAWAYELLSYVPAVKAQRKEDTAEDRDKRAKFLAALYTCPYEERKNVNIERVEGTCHWFTRHSLFQNWLKQKSSVLWTSADPGCGKSVLTRYLIDVFLPMASSSRTICYFFFKDDFANQRSIKDALCGIVRQLLKQQPSLLQKDLIEQHAEDGDKMFNFHELWKILINACNDPTAGEIVCVFDALDECQQTDVKQLIRAICDLHINPIQGSLKILVTSRPYFYIEDAFRDLKEKVPTIHLAGEQDAEIELIEKEINLVIDHRLNSLARSRSLTSKEVSQIKMKLTAVPNRTYIWVHLVFAHIEELLLVTNIRIKKLIQELPRTVNEAYDKILYRSTDKASTKLLLQAILAAFKPLTLQYASIILSLDQSQANLQELVDEVDSDERCRARIRNICGLFVVIFDSKIYLLHQTAREFLLGHSLLNFSQNTSTLEADKIMGPSLISWHASFKLEKCHEFLAECCMRYLLLKHDPCTSIWCYSDQLGGAFRNYCYDFWAKHLREAGSEIELSITQLAAALLETVFSSDSRHQCKCQLRNSQDMEKLLNQINIGPVTITIPAYLGLESVVKFSMQTQSPDKTELSRALCLAARSNHLGIVSLLLSKEVDTNVDSNGRLVNIEYSLEYDSKSLNPSFRYDSNAQKTWGALYHATHHRNTKMMELLLRHGADPNALTMFRETPLHDAVGHGKAANLEVIKLLVDNGARPELEDFEGLIPLARYFVYRRDDEPDVDSFYQNTKVICQLLHTRSFDINKLYEKVYKGPTPIFPDMGAQSDDIRALDFLGYERFSHTLLLEAAGRGSEAYVKVLLKEGADPRIRDTFGRSLVHWSAFSGNCSILKYALSLKLSANDQSTNGQTPLMAAILGRSFEAAEILVEAGAKVDSADHNGFTALIIAAFDLTSYSEDLLEYLQAVGSNVNIADNQGRTALMHLIMNRARTEAIHTLIEKGASVTVQDVDSFTCLHYALGCYAHIDDIKLILSAGADVNIPNNRGHTVLCFAMTKDSESWDKYSSKFWFLNGDTPPEYIEYLIKQGARACESCLLDLIVPRNKRPRHV